MIKEKIKRKSGNLFLGGVVLTGILGIALAKAGYDLRSMSLILLSALVGCSIMAIIAFLFSIITKLLNEKDQK